MKLSLTTRIFLSYAAVLVTFGAVCVFSIAEMHDNQLEIRLLSQGYLPLAQEAAALESLTKNEQRDAERIYHEGNPNTRRGLIPLARMTGPLLSGQSVAAKEVTEAIRPWAPSSERLFIEDLGARFGELARRHDQTALLASELWLALGETSVDPARATPLWEGYGLALDHLGRDIRGVRALLETRVRERVEAAESRERKTGIAIIALSVLAIGVGLLATGIAARTLRPVRTLIEGVSRIGRGDYSAQLGLKGEDEISLLAREFDQMARSLKEREAQLRDKQEALLRAEQLAAVGRISAQVAHEVRNPLSSIGLNVELLEEAFGNAHFATEADARESRDILASVLREVDRLTEVTDQYLQMARLPAPALATENINAVLTSVLDFAREELERSQVHVVRELDVSVPAALADEGQLRQVFLNLLRNSREAMAPRGGTLLVRSGVHADDIEVLFRDTGPGISEDAAARIFEPFFSTKQGGTGLGLALSRQILQAHGGTLEFESGELGGTTFVIRLPRA